MSTEHIVLFVLIVFSMSVIVGICYSYYKDGRKGK